MGRKLKKGKSWRDYNAGRSDLGSRLGTVPGRLFHRALRRQPLQTLLPSSQLTTRALALGQENVGMHIYFLHCLRGSPLRRGLFSNAGGLAIQIASRSSAALSPPNARVQTSLTGSAAAVYICIVGSAETNHF